ncbi:MAG: hypothetical protein CMM02_07990 [Rhodopirellula sp.]|jgi:hypothetical protein|nr:hypothetical protein [Rhodopirellula sp.]
MVNKTFAAVLSLVFLASNGSFEVEADEFRQLLRSGEYVQALGRARANQDMVLRQQQMIQIARHQAASGVQAGALESLASLQDFADGSLIRSTGQAETRPMPSGSQGGAAMADFDTLIDLIKATVAPDSWDDLGGAGTITPFPGGIYVDRDGLMVRLDSRRDSELQGIRREQFDGMFSDKGQDVRETSSMRKVSLVRLQRQLQLLQLRNERADQVMRNLAGIYKIQYVLVYPDQRDIVIAGPAGPWKENGNGRLVNTNNGKPVLKLDYLVELMRNAYSANPTFGCSITPRTANLLKAKQYLASHNGKPLTPQNTDAWIQGLRQSVGRQDVEVFGTDNQTHLAQILVEADHHMKLVGLGEVPGVPGMNSYLDNLVQSDEPTQGVNMLRWWFTTNYQALHASKDGLAFEVVGPAVKVLSENEIVDQLGNRQQTGKSDPLTQQFASEFTSNFEMLAERYPVYQELRNVFDLAVISMLIKSHELDRKVDWNPEFYTQSYGYQPVRAQAVNSVKSVVSYRITTDRVVLAAVSGGVIVDPLPVVNQKNLKQDDYGILNAEYQGNRGIDLPGNTWWWD